MKIIVLGSGGVGKSCCTLRFLRNQFKDDYDPTIEESYRKTVHLDGRKINLEVVDTAGQEEFSQFRDATLSFGDGFFIVYAINDMSSFNSAQNLLSKVQRLKDSDTFPIVMVGNKSDLESERTVPQATAAEFCKKSNCIHFECTAKNNVGLAAAFEALMRDILKKEAPLGKKNGCVCM